MRLKQSKRRSGTIKEIQCMDLMQDYIESLSGDHAKFISKWRSIPTKFANQDLLGKWDIALLYQHYGSINQLYLIQVKDRFSRKVMEGLKQNLPHSALGYYAIYKKPAQKLIDKGSTITLPIGSTNPQFWVIGV